MPFGIVSGGRGNLREVTDLTVEMTEYGGTYNINAKLNGRQVEFDTRENCFAMVRSLMKRSDRYYRNVTLDHWEFRLMKGSSVSLGMRIDMDSTPDEISEHLRLLLEMTVKEDPVSFYDPTDVGNELMD